jgi:hypothetical protein
MVPYRPMIGARERRRQRAGSGCCAVGYFLAGNTQELS